MARISVFGIGYVGAVSAACLAGDGHHVMAVDTDADKINCMNRGFAPVVEAGLRELIAKSVANRRLAATADIGQAVAGTDASFICVGTPSVKSGAIGTEYISQVCEQIGHELGRKSSFHSVIVRSTIVPGTMDELCVPLLERASGKTAGKDFGVGYYPEFLREGTAIKDYHDPGLIVFGALDDITANILRLINANMPVPSHRVPLSTAEAVKYASNAWRAVKITFANEIGNVAKACGIDGQTVMELICKDTKVNISPAFLRPGFAFGGSCLPKDLRALRHLAGEKHIRMPLLEAMLEANQMQVAKAEAMIDSAKVDRLGFVGLSFKPGTDDLRESPLVELANRFIGKGYGIKIYDPSVGQAHRARVRSGSGEAPFPDLAERLVDNIADLIDGSDLILVGNRYEETIAPLEIAARTKPMVDLTRVDRKLRSNDLYQGICW